MKFVGFDLETSGTDLDAGHVPIQVGAAVGLGVSWGSLVGWPLRDIVGRPSLESWNEDAAKVHGLTIEDVSRAYADGQGHVAVDLELSTWFVSRGAKERDLVGVGWNVGSFDFPFVRRYFPRVAALFSYRFVDLNSVCFTLAQVGRRRARHPEQSLGAQTWKKRAKQEAERMLGEAKWHDAEYDARASLAAWEWLCSRLSAREI